LHYDISISAYGGWEIRTLPLRCFFHALLHCRCVVIKSLLISKSARDFKLCWLTQVRSRVASCYSLVNQSSEFFKSVFALFDPMFALRSNKTRLTSSNANINTCSTTPKFRSFLPQHHSPLRWHQLELGKAPSSDVRVPTGTHSGLLHLHTVPLLSIVEGAGGEVGADRCIILERNSGVGLPASRGCGCFLPPL
jgi:hypothetical protein